ncbi:MAG: hypothetical protein KAR33_03065 [Candidatus Thorarchaeota archaeon]|nr:hypothetical protein [Candidatus Thorarchaeota archaeon]
MTSKTAFYHSYVLVFVLLYDLGEVTALEAANNVNTSPSVIASIPTSVKKKGMNIIQSELTETMTVFPTDIRPTFCLSCVPFVASFNSPTNKD